MGKPEIIGYTRGTDWLVPHPSIRLAWVNPRNGNIHADLKDPVRIDTVLRSQGWKRHYRERPFRAQAVYGGYRMYCKADVTTTLTAGILPHDWAVAHAHGVHGSIAGEGEYVQLNKWHPDCGGDYTLSGVGYFASYWPDNTVVASVLAGSEPDGPELATSGIKQFSSKGACQTYAEVWIRKNWNLRTTAAAAGVADDECGHFEAYMGACVACGRLRKDD